MTFWPLTITSIDLAMSLVLLGGVCEDIRRRLTVEERGGVQFVFVTTFVEMTIFLVNEGRNGIADFLCGQSVFTLHDHVVVSLLMTEN
jgi:hypothetical protein